MHRDLHLQKDSPWWYRYSTAVVLLILLHLHKLQVALRIVALYLPEIAWTANPLC